MKKDRRHRGRSVRGRAVNIFAGVLVFVCATGCSNFERQWRDLAAGPPVEDAAVGRWQGRWYSETAEHGDTLRCIVTRRDDGTYDAWFRARFMKVLVGEYHAELVVTGHGNHLQVRAEADLGTLAGGVYRQEGRIQDDRYTTRYTSKKDRGTLAMQRLPPD